jgi:hypothetical protein
MKKRQMSKRRVRGRAAQERRSVSYVVRRRVSISAFQKAGSRCEAEGTPSIRAMTFRGTSEYRGRNTIDRCRTASGLRPAVRGDRSLHALGVRAGPSGGGVSLGRDSGRTGRGASSASEALRSCLFVASPFSSLRPGCAPARAFHGVSRQPVRRWFDSAICPSRSRELTSVGESECFVRRWWAMSTSPGKASRASLEACLG